MSEYINSKGYIYLIKMCDTNYRTIYKIGKSTNFDKRIKNYNYIEILNFIISDDINNDENEIIKIFNLNCKIDKGREFFTAKDDSFVLKLFVNYFNNKINNISNIIISNSNIIIDKNIVVNNTDTYNTDTYNNDNVKLVESDKKSEIIDNVELLESNENLKIIDNNKILGRTCPTCSKVFDYSSRLKAHMEITFHCKKTSEEIDKFFLQFKKQANFKCNICSNEFTKNHNLKRHINNSNCKIEFEKKEKEIEKKKQILIIQKQIDYLKNLQKNKIY
jgi:hypothetical protein